MHTLHANIGINRRTGINFIGKVLQDINKNRELYILILPVILFYLLFHYKPMYGAIIAFKEFSPARGIMGSPWVGLKHFEEFFSSYYFLRVMKNTLTISFFSIIIGFPIPIILALFINEIRNRTYARIVQTITYMPHFISLVVICGLVKDFTLDSGVINSVIGMLGGEKMSMLNQPDLFVPIYVISDIWQQAGWASIIYIAAIAGIDEQLYEASRMDGAGRLRQVWHITIPSIMPTIIILLILRMGRLMNVGFEKIILLYNPVLYDTADVISSFVYRRGIQDFNFSYSSAVGLFNSVINLTMLILANWISKKVNEFSLW